MGNWRVGLTEAEGLLRSRDWERGWPLYANFAWGGLFDPISEEVPEWKGQELKGRRILIIPVGGYGDNIMCFRWFEELKNLGASVSYLCPQPLYRLFKGHPWVDRISSLSEGQEFNIVRKDYDYFCPSMALPMKFGGEPLPWKPYISMPSDYQIGVGLCSRAGEELDSTKRRSMSRVSEMAVRLIKVKWVNLNYGENPEIKDFLDTARIISHLQAVVTVDTAVLHLSGAMGVKTFAFLGKNADWKFGFDSVCPFYPSVKVVRDPGSLAEELGALRGEN